MKTKLLLVALCLVGIWRLFVWADASDKRRAIVLQHRIQECKDMGGHPVLYYNNSFEMWLLETCKM